MEWILVIEKRVTLTEMLKCWYIWAFTKSSKCNQIRGEEESSFFAYFGQKYFCGCLNRFENKPTT